jgi:UDP-N-acetylmuramyl pentapeptide phosphotransferase/UDP-N-acetylglucosamine-1-phosphate transferase
MSNLQWLLFFLLVLGLELFYFRVARAFKILDYPNDRNLHTQPIIRGGGIIFFLAVVLYSLVAHPASWFTIIGLTLVSIAGLLDDIRSLSSGLRFMIQLVSVGLIFCGLDVYPAIWMLVILIVIGVGALNAFNFMDGINGITGGYSLVALGSLAYVNRNIISFADPGFIVSILIGVFVFCIFNFRNKAICFAGDVGSLSIGFIIISLVMALVVLSGNWMYLLFLSVYGADTALTMVHRIIMKENIFKPHRHHLFQVIVYKTKITHVQMTMVYMAVQLLCNVILLTAMGRGMRMNILIVATQVFLFTGFYVGIKRKLATC